MKKYTFLFMFFIIVACYSSCKSSIMFSSDHSLFNQQIKIFPNSAIRYYLDYPIKCGLADREFYLDNKKKVKIKTGKILLLTSVNSTGLTSRFFVPREHIHIGSNKFENLTFITKDKQRLEDFRCAELLYKNNYSKNSYLFDAYLNKGDIQNPNFVGLGKDTSRRIDNKYGYLDSCFNAFNSTQQLIPRFILQSDLLSETYFLYSSLIKLKANDST